MPKAHPEAVGPSPRCDTDGGKRTRSCGGEWALDTALMPQNTLQPQGFGRTEPILPSFWSAFGFAQLGPTRVRCYDRPLPPPPLPNEDPS